MNTVNAQVSGWCRGSCCPIAHSSGAGTTLVTPPRGPVLHPAQVLISAAMLELERSRGGARKRAYGERDGALGRRSWRHRETAVVVSTDREACYDSPPTSTSVEGPPPEWSVVISGKQGPVSSLGSGPHS